MDGASWPSGAVISRDRSIAICVDWKSKGRRFRMIRLSSVQGILEGSLEPLDPSVPRPAMQCGAGSTRPVLKSAMAYT